MSQRRVRVWFRGNPAHYDEEQRASMREPWFEFVTTDITLAELARRRRLPLADLRAQARREGWAARRRSCRADIAACRAA